MKFTRSEKILLTLLALIQFVNIVDFMIMMPMGPILMRLFELQPKQFGFLVSSYGIAAGVSGFVSAFFIDRFDRKKSLLFFFLGFTAGTLACSLAPNYELLLAARFITGLFGGVLGSLVMSIVSDAINYERRGTAMGIVMGAFSVASVVGVPFALKLANDYNWHAPFLFLAFISFFIWLAIAILMQPMKSHVASQKPNPLHTIKQIFGSANQVYALLFMLCLVLGQFTVIPYLSQSFVANAGLLESQLPLIYLFGGICSFFASPLAGKLSDRYTKHKVFAYSIFLSIIPIFLITNLGPHPAWVLLLLSSSFFIVMSGRMVPAMAMISSAPPVQSRGGFMSIVTSVQQLTAAVAASLAGFIVVTDDQKHFLNYHYVGYIAILFSIIAFFISKKIVTNDEERK